MNYAIGFNNFEYMITRKKSLILFTYLTLVSIIGLSFSCTQNGELPESKQNDNKKVTQQEASNRNVRNVFSYDTLETLNENNLIKKQIRGRWQLDSILIDSKRVETKFVLNGLDIEGLNFKPNFYLQSSTKEKKGVYMFNQLGVYHIDKNNLFIKEIDGTLIDDFQIDKSSERSLILTEKFRNGIKIYYFSLDLDHDKTQRSIYGPDYK